MKTRGARWLGVLAAVSLMTCPSWAMDQEPNRTAIHGIEWRWGAEGSRRLAPTQKRWVSPLFPRDKPWGTNEYLLIGAGVVVTIALIVVGTKPPHP